MPANFSFVSCSSSPSGRLRRKACLSTAAAFARDCRRWADPTLSGGPTFLHDIDTAFADEKAPDQVLGNFVTPVALEWAFR